MGWNEIQINQSHPLLNNLNNESKFYFVHSYYVQCNNKENVLATTMYGLPFHSVVGQGNILGTQFHPEKSHRYGVQLLTNFVDFHP